MERHVERRAITRRLIRKASCASAAAVIAAALAVAGCGSSSSEDQSTGSSPASTSQTGTSASGTTQTLAEAKAAARLEGPTPTGPRAVSGKRIWWVGCGDKFEACADGVRYFRDAGKILGWTVEAPDTQGSTAIQNQVIRTAIAAKADAIVIESVDCPPIKSALQAAKAAGIPVVDLFGLNCDNPAFDGGPSLFVSPRYGGTTDVARLFADRGVSDARVMLAVLREKGVEKPEVAYVNSGADQVFWVAYWDKWTEFMKENCPDCRLNNAGFNVAQWPNPGTQIAQTALNAHPGTNAVAYASDFVLASSLAGPIFARDKVVCCGDGLTQSRDKIRSGGMEIANSGTLLPWEMMSWGVASTVNRLLAGEDPERLPNEGSGFAYVDRENVGEPGSPVRVPVDFKAIYTKMWTGR
ncbi:substrate-binding domain-containing protein [Conexibacter sp. CPCC 206217]|uniref:sugar ABC transporter substrate-binding protein n=1 Tax=Conexibacter sp. CPCC 206217 TaxID=3064574 RepID=UPI002717D1B7|nr:substrate-binding domain-containing protein [Conexibacter sp. CPCC 206217]MDO8209607.1 substrate-binding domain-containing protein [Conexibacter sp. CPCC 206217]